MNFEELTIRQLEQNNISTIKDFVNILDNSFDGIALSSRDGVIFYVNKALERITGINRRYIVNKKPNVFVKDGLILKVAKKVLNKYVTNDIHMAKTGKVFLITTVPIYFKNKMMYFSNYRELDELNSLQQELLDESKKSLRDEYIEEFKELVNIFPNQEIIIKSPPMNKIMKTISKIAQTDIVVNLSGESGVGKDVIARLIHNLSHRKGNPFVHINCGSIPENLLESELFGYIEGSFTGASRGGRSGLLESAGQGTVFLDEIGDLPLALQVKLLKVLQDWEIYRIGGRKPIKLDIRIICATNHNLAQMVKDEKFREDLYFRINMLPIHIPPLRERKEVIVHLCYFYLQKFNKKYDKKKSFSIEVSNKLEAYHWPGNVRELKSLIERLVILSENDKISIDDLQGTIIKHTHLNKQQTYETENLKAIIENVEKDVILQSIEKYGSRKAAEKLGIDYSTLKRKKKKYFHING